MDEQGRFIWTNGTETEANGLCVFAHQQPAIGVTRAPTDGTQATPANDMRAAPSQSQPPPPAANPAITPAPAGAPNYNMLLSMMVNMQTQMLQLAVSRETRSTTSAEEAQAKLFKFGTLDRFDGSKKEKVR
jgi:hypothetical protein